MNCYTKTVHFALFFTGVLWISHPSLATTLEPNEELRRAIQLKNKEKFEAALKAGANPSEKDLIGKTSLHQVVTFWGDLAAIEKLLALKVDINAADPEGITPLLQALQYAHYSSDLKQLEQVVQLLLSKGARADIKDKNHRTPISRALELGHLPLIETLIQAGSKLPADALMKTLTLGINLPLINFLMKHSSELDLNLRNPSGKTALYLAAKDEKLLFLLRWLVLQGADLQMLDNDGASALYPATLHNNTKAMVYLYEQGLKLDNADKDKQQAIHLSAYGGQYATLQWLIERGADLQAKDRWGRRALDIAIESYTFTFASEAERLALAKLLGGDQRDVARGRFPNLPLRAAVMAQNLDKVEQLLKAGENVNLKDEAGRTPLARAIELYTAQGIATPNEIAFGRKLLRLVMQHGADTTLRLPINGMTYEEYAEQQGIGKELQRLKELYSPYSAKSR